MNRTTTAVGLVALLGMLSDCAVAQKYIAYQYSIVPLSPDIEISGFGTYSVYHDNTGCHLSSLPEMPSVNPEFPSLSSFSDPFQERQIEKELLEKYCR